MISTDFCSGAYQYCTVSLCISGGNPVGHPYGLCRKRLWGHGRTYGGKSDCHSPHGDALTGFHGKRKSVLMDYFCGAAGGWSVFATMALAQGIIYGDVTKNVGFS